LLAGVEADVGEDGAAEGEQPTTAVNKTVTSSHREIRTLIRVSFLSPTGAQ
jgi:hypothetical protein